MYITAIEPRRKGLRALYLDGEFAVTVDTQTLLLYAYREGDEMSDEQLHELIEASNSHRAKEKALWLLSHRDHSKKELKDKIKRTAGERAAEEAAQRMEEIGLVNDEAYARRYAKELLYRRHFSQSRTEYELIQKGIDRDLIHEIIEGIEVDPQEQIADLLERKYARSLQDEKGKKRTIAALQRLGYRWEDIRKALADRLSDPGEDDWGETI